MCTENKLEVGIHTQNRPISFFGFSFHDALLRLSTLIQHGRTASKKHTQYTLINCAQAQMTWQNCNFFPEAAHSQIPPARSQEPKSRASRAAGFVPVGTRVPPTEAVAAVAPRGTSWTLPLTLSEPATAAAPRAPPGSAAQRARGRPSPPPFPHSGEPGRAVSPPRQRGRRLPGRPASLHLPPASRRPQSSRRPGPIPSPPQGRRSGPARRGAAERPRRAGAYEGAAAASMSARPSQKRGAQRTKRGGGAGGAGAQADPADPRGISGARSPGNPAP